MAVDHGKHEKETRPDFMVALGLMPPYSPEDVKIAYLTMAKRLHPDKGGSAEAFHALQESYEQAKQFVEFKGDRRGWIAGKMDQYLAVQRVIEALQELGAEAESDSVDWLQKSFGDFAQLTENIIRVRLAESDKGDQLVQLMVAEHPVLAGVKQIELPGCRLSDAAVLRLGAFKQLRSLDLSRTPVTGEAMAVIESLPALRTLDLEGSKVGWWAKRKVRTLLRQRAESGPASLFS